MSGNEAWRAREEHSGERPVVPAGGGAKEGSEAGMKGEPPPVQIACPGRFAGELPNVVAFGVRACRGRSALLHVRRSAAARA